MSTTLPLFWSLSSPSKRVRVDASVKLVAALEQFQAAHVPEPKSDSSDNEGDGLDVLNSQDVSYSIRRLVRGLASPRESSRLGFSVALTELLSRIDTVTCGQVLDLIVDGTQRRGSMSGQEERDVLFARLFGIAAVVRSGLLVRQRPLSPSSSSPISSLEVYTSVLTCLLELGDAKSWLRESAWWTIGLAVDALEGSTVPWKTQALESTIEVVYSGAKGQDGSWTPDKVAMTLQLQTMTPNHDWEGTMAPVFKGRNVLASHNLSALGRILKESAVDEQEASNAHAGSWKAQLHVAWDVIFDRLIPPPGSDRVPQGSFSEFFRTVVDETLFSPSSSPERKYWGFQVFKKALGRVGPTELPMLFTKNLMRSWINHLSNKDRYLHKISLDVAKHIQTLVQTSPSLGFPLILQLTGVHGSGQFDKLTRTKTIESILTVMDSAGIKSYILSLLEQVNALKDKEEEPSIVDARRTWIADQFSALVRNGSIPKDDEWIQMVLDFYVVHGLFVVSKKIDKSPIHWLRVLPSPPFTEAVQRHCRERLLGCLGVLNAQLSVVKQGEQTHKETGVASDGEFWTSKTLATVALLDKDSKRVKPLIDIDEQIRDTFVKTEKAIAQSKKTSADEREVARGFELILSSFLLQYRCGEADGLDNLEATLEAASTMFSSDKPKRSKKAASEDKPPPIDVLVDVMIGFLEGASAFGRSVANESFSRVTSAVQGSTVDLILSQLERRDPGDLVDQDEEMESDEEEGEEEEEEEEESSAEEEEESDSEEGDDDDADQVRQKIQEALKANGMDVEEDDSEDDSDEELMDDEQMMALDDTLAEIFRSRTGDKKSRKGVDAQREATHFKNRVLDLVDIYVKREPQSPLNVRLVWPLIELAIKSTTDERQLSDKASGILKNRLGKSRELPTTALRDEIEPVLHQVHQAARRSRASGAPDAPSVLSQASLYLCRILVSLGEDGVVLRAYGESWDDYASRKASQLAFSFFQDWARRFPALGWRLRERVLASSDGAVNVYRKCQAFQLLQVLSSQPDKGEDPAAGVAFHEKLQRTILDLVTHAVDDDRGLSPAQTKDVLKVVLSCVRQTLKTPESSSANPVWDPAAWKTLHDRLSSSGRFKSSTSVLDMCRQVESAAERCKQKAGAKRKAQTAEADSSTTSNRKKQKKK